MRCTSSGGHRHPLEEDVHAFSSEASNQGEICGELRILIAYHAETTKRLLVGHTGAKLVMGRPIG